ncbi:MAG: ankyrin repeat domain-containing protein [Sulfuricurvum sp.]
MKKTFLISFFLLCGVQAAEILNLVGLLDRNDMSGFEQNVQNTVDANAMRDDNNKTILMYASWIGNEEAVRYLVDKGADVNAVDSGGATALHLAIWKGHNPIALYLLDHGASATRLSNDGMSPTDIALLRQNQPILEAIEHTQSKLKSLF